MSTIKVKQASGPQGTRKGGRSQGRPLWTEMEPSAGMQEERSREGTASKYKHAEHRQSQRGCKDRAVAGVGGERN